MFIQESKTQDECERWFSILYCHVLSNIFLDNEEKIKPKGHGSLLLTAQPFLLYSVKKICLKLNQLMVIKACCHILR